MLDQEQKTAKLYRMATPDHVCPFGLKSKGLLEQEGFEIDDHPLESRIAAAIFKIRHGVKTTPQTFIGNNRVGGYDALRRFIGLDGADSDRVTYVPVITVCAMAALMALGTSWAAFGSPLTLRAGEWFGAFAMCILAFLKLRDIESFKAIFLDYDLLARTWGGYARIYPFVQAAAGLLMIAGALIGLAAPLAAFIGTVGVMSVFEAVYVKRRNLKCACVGGGSNVPLGAVSLAESLLMVAMALWMSAKPLIFQQS